MILLRAPAALCVMLLSSFSWSQEVVKPLADWYQVEIAAFAHEPADIDAQFWDLSLKIKLPEGALLLGTSNQPQLSAQTNANPTEPQATTEAQNSPPASSDLPTPFIIRPDLPSSLNNLSRLSRARGYRLLTHQRWLQHLPADAQQPSIRLHGGDLLDETIFPDERYELDGSILLTRARFLHINTDLYLTIPTPAGWKPANRAPQAVLDALASVPPSLQSPAPEIHPPDWLTVNLQQKRRMRSNELHYLDHPMFGVLIKITPYTPAAQTMIGSSSLLAQNTQIQPGATAAPETPIAERKTLKTAELESTTGNQANH